MDRAGDRYGYYQVGDIRTYSRFERMDLLHEHPCDWRWVYNDEFFSQYDRTQEPTASLDELYKKRAEQLRRDYDYLIFYYSGGYDSANMLHAFLDNNIYPDEICIFYSRHDRVSHQYLELRDITWKKVEDIEKRYPQIKIRKLDYSDYICQWDKIIDRFNTGKRYLDHFGGALTLNHIILDVICYLVDDWKLLIEQGKNVAQLHGADKPQLRYYNNQWLFTFHDALAQLIVGPFGQMVANEMPNVHEAFYWAPTDLCAKIMIKQSHLLKKLYDPQALEDFSKIEGAKKYVEGYGWDIDRMSLPYVKTIYPRNFVGDEQFFLGKNPAHVWGNRDQWYFNSNHPGSQKHWAMYLSTFEEQYSHWRKWYNDGKSIDSSFINSMGQDYII